MTFTPGICEVMAHMKLKLLQTLSTETVVVVTDDIAKVSSIKGWKLEQVSEFDETDPARAKWIPDACLGAVKELIEQQGYARLVDGNAVAGLPEAFGFFPKESLQLLPAYWGWMWKLGAFGNTVSAYRVQFHDSIPHRFHSHSNHSELIFVVAGAINQTIGSEQRRLAAGDVAVISKGARHQAIPLLPGTEVLVILFGDGGDYEVTTLE
ncbi:MAG: hypothetical protein JWM68_2077 [Verrucomicrobiales bacterium]|nr:hypothetical protein [Verrucomicrobiales bacterium]